MKLKTKPQVRFVGSGDLVQALKRKRPDLVAASHAAPLREVVGRNLLRLRVDRGLSRHALAERTVDVGERTIQRIEEAREDSNPTVRVLEELAKALKVPATALTDPKATLLGEEAYSLGSSRVKTVDL
jgi:ribosome-binding protein aMBF1 (putative translation factor)